MAVPKRVYVFLVIGILAASQSGNIIRIGSAPSAAIAAWRLLLATAVLAPFGLKDARSLTALSKKEICLLIVAGVALAAHFISWIAAVKLTTVASASMFFAINPVLTAVAGYFIFGERMSAKLLIAIGLGIAGVAVIGGSDLNFDPDHIAGDALSLLCSALFTVYFLLGKKLRQKLATNLYVTCVYGIAALCCFAVMGAINVPFAGYSSRNWICFGLMALIPTVLGHTAFNNALRFIAAGRISAATLTEPLLAGTVAYFAWDEGLRSGAMVGYAMIAASVLVLVLDRQKLKSS